MTKQIDSVRIRSETNKEASNEHLSSNLPGFLFYPGSARERIYQSIKFDFPLGTFALQISGRIKSKRVPRYSSRKSILYVFLKNIRTFLCNYE